MYKKIALELIKEAESFKAEEYLCPAGKRTIGYGHNLEANPLTDEQKELLNEDGTITEENASKLLLMMLPKYESSARRLVDFESLDDVRKALIIDLVYNMGEGNFEDFKNTRRFIDAHDFNNAWKNLRASRWFKQVGYRAIRNCAIMRDGVVYNYNDVEKLKQYILN